MYVCVRHLHLYRQGKFLPPPPGLRMVLLHLFTKEKDFLLATSHKGITISSSLSKLLKLNSLYPFLDEINVPDHLQTAYQKGLSCSDAIFAMQEALLIHLREGGHPCLCLFDLEKAIGSIEHSILLERLFEVGVNSTLF